MNTYLYWLGLFFLAIQVVYSAFVLVVSLLQLVKLNTNGPDIKHAKLSVGLQMLQALIMILIVVGIYYSLFKDDRVPTSVATLVSGALLTMDSLLRRYHASRLPL